MVTAQQLTSEEYATKINYFDPDDYIITILRRAIANRQDLQLADNNGGGLLLLGGRGEYFAEPNDVETLCKLPTKRISVRVLKSDDRRIPENGDIGRSVDELMWHAGYHASAGRLPQGCFQHDVVELTRWPNLTRLPHTINTPRIAALLFRRPTSIAFASWLLQVEKEEICQFYSAARCAGVARVLNRATEEPKLEPHRQNTLLSALLRKLAGL